jgi:hypothetical protein
MLVGCHPRYHRCRVGTHTGPSRPSHCGAGGLHRRWWYGRICQRYSHGTGGRTGGAAWWPGVPLEEPGPAGRRDGVGQRRCGCCRRHRGVARGAVGQCQRKIPWPVATSSSACIRGITACRPPATRLTAAESTVVAGRKPKDVPQLQWINTVFGNLKTSLSGSYHSFGFRK